MVIFIIYANDYKDFYSWFDGGWMGKELKLVQYTLISVEKNTVACYYINIKKAWKYEWQKRGTF